MRIIADIPHSDCKISILSMNQKFIIRIEQGSMEQIYKVSEADVPTLENVKEIITDNFMQTCLERFNAMRKDLYEAMEKF